MRERPLLASGASGTNAGWSRPCTYLLLAATLLAASSPAAACGSGSSASTDSSSGSYSSAGGGGSRCADLVLFPVGSVDPADQYRFDYSDVGFGTTHARGASVTVSCTSNGQSSQVYAFDSSRSSITSGSSILATCSNASGRSAWTVNGRTLQFVDCRLF